MSLSRSSPARAERSPTAGARGLAAASSLRGGARLMAALFRARPLIAVGYAIVLAATLAGAFAPWLSPYDPVTANPDAYLAPPGRAHWLGADNTGMDILTRILYAPRTDFVIAIAGAAASFAIGAPLGALVGFYEGRDRLRRAFAVAVMRTADVLQSFPVFVFAIALVAVFGQGLPTIVLAIAFVNAPVYLRLMRSQVQSVRGMRYVEAAYVAGASDLALLARHIVPNAIHVALTQLSVTVGWAILLTAGLSFVGAGVVPPTPEWGGMIATGFQSVMTGQWWPSIFPGIAIGLTVFGFGLIGASIEILVDPAQRRRLLAKKG